MDLSRRTYLRLSSLGVVGTAGCMSPWSAPEIRTVANDRRRDASSGDPSGDGSAGYPPVVTEDHCSADPTIEDQDSLTVGFDARERFKCKGQPIDNFEALDHWETYSGSLTADEEDVFSGSQSARVEAGPADERAAVYREFPEGVDLSASDLSIALKLEAPTTQRIVVRLDAPDERNALFMSRFVRKSGWLRVDLGPRRTRGTPDLADVTAISVIAYTGGGTRVQFNVDSLRLRPSTGSGRVLLTFDDNYQSQREVAFPVMEQYGFRGTVGAVPGTTDWTWQMSLHDLRELQSAGWDVASIPKTASGFQPLPPDEQATRIRESKQWLLDNGFERGANVLFWPYGRYDRTSLRAASRYHQLGFTGGTTPVGMVSGPLTIGRIDGEDVDAVKRAVDFAAEYGQLVSVAYGAVGNMTFGMSRAEFEETMAYVDDAGLEVVTASELWQSLQ